MPLEEDVKRLKHYTLTEMSRPLQDEYLHWGRNEFNKMRSLIVCRLTLFNARRGGEPARITLKEYQDALDDSWVDPQLVERVQDPVEKALLNQF